MPEWNDVGIILSAKKYGEKGLIINILTETHGRYVGWINNYKTKSILSSAQPGNLVKVYWKSRIIEQMGNFKIELISSYNNHIFFNFSNNKIYGGDFISHKNAGSQAFNNLATELKEEILPIIYKSLVQN